MTRCLPPILCLATLTLLTFNCRPTWAADEVKASATTSSPELSAGEKQEGFVSLFDGKSLDGWMGAVDGYEAKDGVIVCKPSQHGNLYTSKEYSDFVFRAEFKLTPGANNGFGIRTPPQGDAAYVGMEIQVLDDTAPQYKNLHPYQYCGSIYGVVPAKTGHLKPVGEWNDEEITAKGRQVTVKLNGDTIVDANLDEASKDGTVDGKQHPGLKRDKGYIGFLGHSSLVEFRNLRLKDLSGDKK